MIKLIRALIVTLVPALVWAGPVDVNTADAATIAKELEGIGLSEGAGDRCYTGEKNGAFRSADDLRKVEGIGDKVLEQNRANIQVEKAGRRRRAKQAKPAQKQAAAAARARPAPGLSGVGGSHGGALAMRRRRRCSGDPRCARDQDGGFPGGRPRDAIPAGDQGEPEGNAADRRQAADPVRGGGSAGRGRPQAGLHHRQLEARDRGSLRHRPELEQALEAQGKSTC